MMDTKMDGVKKISPRVEIQKTNLQHYRSGIMQDRFFRICCLIRHAVL